MAYVTTKRVNKKKKSLFHRILFFFITIVFLFFLFIFSYVDPLIVSVSEATIKSLTIQAVSQAVSSVIGSNPSYSDLITIVKDNNGNITMIQANSLTANILSRQVVDMSQTNITKFGDQGISIPMGTLSGITLIAGQGPDITVKVMPVGIVNSTFESQFTTAGINQTDHKIFISVTANVKVVIPGSNKMVQTVTQILVAENIIIGKVPDTYLNSSNISDMLNLIP